MRCNSTRSANEFEVLLEVFVETGNDDEPPTLLWIILQVEHSLESQAILLPHLIVLKDKVGQLFVSQLIEILLRLIAAVHVEPRIHI
jgi:hypothetical protein